MFQETATQCCAPTEVPGLCLLHYPPLGGRPSTAAHKGYCYYYYYCYCYCYCYCYYYYYY